MKQFSELSMEQGLHLVKNENQLGVSRCCWPYVLNQEDGQEPGELSGITAIGNPGWWVLG